MSEVKRYHVTDAGLVEGQALGRINVVLGPEYDSAVQCFLTAAEGCVAAERRERALQALLTAADERADVMAQALHALSALIGLPINGPQASQDELLTIIWEALGEECSALKPAEGGGDERPAGCCCPPKGHKGIWAAAICPVHHGLKARVALLPENQRITPARFNCLACGDIHPGSGNLPCPKMSPTC